MSIFKNIGEGVFGTGTNPNDNPLPGGFFQRVVTVINNLVLYIYNGVTWVKAKLFARNIGNYKELLKPIISSTQQYRTLTSENNTIRLIDNGDTISVEDSTFNDITFKRHLRDFFKICYYSQTNLDNTVRSSPLWAQSRDITDPDNKNFIPNFTNDAVATGLDFNPIRCNDTKDEYKWRVYVDRDDNIPDLKIEKYDSVTKKIYYSEIEAGQLQDYNVIEILNPYVNYTNVKSGNTAFFPGLNNTIYDGKEIKYNYPAGYIALEDKLIIFVGLIFKAPDNDKSAITYAIIDSNNFDSSYTLFPTPLISTSTANDPSDLGQHVKTISSRYLEFVEKLGEQSMKYIGVGFCTYDNSDIVSPIYYYLDIIIENQKEISFLVTQPKILNFDPTNFVLGTGNHDKVWANAITKYKGKWRVQFWDYSTMLADGGFTAEDNSDHFEVIFDLPLGYIVAGSSGLNDYTKTTIHTIASQTGYLRGLGLAMAYVHLDGNLFMLHGIDNRGLSTDTPVQHYLTRNNYEYTIAELNSDNVTWSWDKSGPYLMNPVEWTETQFAWQNDHMGGGTYFFKYKNDYYILTSTCTATNTYQIVLLKLRDYYKGKELKDYTKNDFTVHSSLVPYVQQNADIIIGDCTTTNKQITLKPASEWVGKCIYLKRIGSSGGPIMGVYPSAGDTIDGVTYINLTTTTCFKSIGNNKIIII